MTTITPKSTVSKATAIGLAKVMGATPAQISALTTAVSSPQATQATIAAAKSAPSGQLFPTSPNNLSVSSSPITAEVTKPQQPIQLPVPAPIPDYSGLLTTGMAPTTTTATTTTKPSTTEDIIMQLISGQEKPPSLSGEYAKAESEAGIAQKQQLVNDYNAQLNAITAKAQADILSLTGQGRGIPEVIIGGQQAKINKEAAIQALPIQAQLAAAQGNLQYAQQRLDTLFKLKMEDATNEYNYRKEVRTAVYNHTTKSEKARLDNLQRLDDRAYQEKIDFLKTQDEMVKSAVSQGAPQAIVNAIKSATNSNEAIMAAGEYAGTIKPKAGFELSAGQTRYEYDPKTGKAVAVASVAPKASGTGVGGGITEKPIFTTTQLNNGAENAKITMEDFKTLNPDVQNFYINADKKNLDVAISEIKAVSDGTKTLEEVTANINGANTLSQPVKEYFIQKAIEADNKLEKSPSFWGKVKSFFGF